MEKEIKYKLGSTLEEIEVCLSYLLASMKNNAKSEDISCEEFVCYEIRDKLECLNKIINKFSIWP